MHRLRQISRGGARRDFSRAGPLSPGEGCGPAAMSSHSACRLDMACKLHVAIMLALATVLLRPLSAHAINESASGSLASPESFATTDDPAVRSAAMFIELGKVLPHPRCVNCHPAGDRPRQGEQGRLHQPPVERGPDGLGLAAMRCSNCHQEKNFDP